MFLLSDAHLQLSGMNNLGTTGAVMCETEKMSWISLMNTHVHTLSVRNILGSSVGGKAHLSKVNIKRISKH